jgi:hypothetical protein
MPWRVRFWVGALFLHEQNEGGSGGPGGWRDHVLFVVDRHCKRQAAKPPHVLVDKVQQSLFLVHGSSL